MPTAPRDAAPAGAESFDDILGRVARVRERLEAAGASASSPSATTASCTTCSARTMFGDDFGPEHLPGTYHLGHANTGISIFTRHDTASSTALAPGWALTTWNDAGAS